MEHDLNLMTDGELRDLETRWRSEAVGLIAKANRARSVYLARDARMMMREAELAKERWAAVKPHEFDPVMGDADDVCLTCGYTKRNWFHDSDHVLTASIEQTIIPAKESL